MSREFDVVVVGAGNAAMCAALAAAEKGARVGVLECAPEEESAGNTRFTAGGIRFAYDGVDDLKAIMPDLTEQEIETTDFGSYSTDQFYDDMFRAGAGSMIEHLRLTPAQVGRTFGDLSVEVLADADAILIGLRRQGQALVSPGRTSPAMAGDELIVLRRQARDTDDL